MPQHRLSGQNLRCPATDCQEMLRRCYVPFGLPMWSSNGQQTTDNKKEARFRGPLDQAPTNLVVVMMTVVTVMPARTVVADRLEIDAGNAGRDVEAGLALHADRLQCIGVVRTAEQEVTAGA